jgi:hypothetical protein
MQQLDFSEDANHVPATGLIRKGTGSHEETSLIQCFSMDPAHADLHLDVSARDSRPAVVLRCFQGEAAFEEFASAANLREQKWQSIRPIRKAG